MNPFKYCPSPLLPLHSPKSLLPTQAVERGSGQEANRTHMGCSVGVERVYSAWFP